MKKALIALALLSLAVTNAEAHGGWSGHNYHGGGWGGHDHHGGGWGGHDYRGGGWGGDGFWWGAGLGAALTFPFYYSRSWADPGPYYSYPGYYDPSPTVYVNPPVYVQSQPVYVQSQPNYAVAATQPRTVVTQASNNGVIELGPVNAQPPENYNSAQPQSSNAGQASSDQWFVYPSKGQSPDQQANDRYECNRWAANESGYDPELRSHRNPETGPVAYGRALSACLEGRGYAVK